MKQTIGYVAVVVRDYDEAIKFYVEKLGFNLVEDTFIEAQDKRWVIIAPPGSIETKVLLARAVDVEQSSRIGNQTGGRVFLFLHTDDFWRDFNAYKSKGVVFVREPAEETQLAWVTSTQASKANKQMCVGASHWCGLRLAILAVSRSPYRPSINCFSFKRIAAGNYLRKSSKESARRARLLP